MSRTGIQAYLRIASTILEKPVGLAISISSSVLNITIFFGLNPVSPAKKAP
jgi:hypothetical protein